MNVEQGRSDRFPEATLSRKPTILMLLSIGS